MTSGNPDTSCRAGYVCFMTPETPLAGILSGEI
jgi:hypothetical protein